MIKLLNAGFTRLRKNRAFWLFLIFSIFMYLFMIYTQYKDMKEYGEVIQVEQIILNYSTIIGIVVAIFVSLFLGVEYSDGAIRNKITIGHSRIQIYLSNLIIVSIASVFCYIVFSFISACVGTPLFGWVKVEGINFTTLFIDILFLIMAFSAIDTFIAMVCSNKTYTAIGTIIVAFLMMMIALTCFNLLCSSPIIQTVTINESGEMITKEEPNPRYPTEKEMKIYQTIVDFLPAGQAFQIAGGNNTNFNILPVYSLVNVIIFTGAGLIIFNKKELK